MSVAVLCVFVAVYAGMALGRWPGLAIDRTGVAVIGAIALYLFGALDGTAILAAIDFPTLAILFALMVVSAQFAEARFFDWCAHRLAGARMHPLALLAIVVGAVGALSSVLTNDIVVWAVMPVLIDGLRRRAIDPRPFVVATACAANAGSAATLIGNPQNILIGQHGGLDFAGYLAHAALPALAGLALVWAVVGWRWRAALHDAAALRDPDAAPSLDHAALAKAVAATALVLSGFVVPQAQMPLVLAAPGFLLLSRRFGSREMFAMVDWHLLLLFAGLFCVTHALSALPETAALTARTFPAEGGPGLPVLLAVSLIGSNTIGNVPLVTLVLALGLPLDTAALHALAVFSTLSGNLLLIGSVATIIAVERAGAAGVRVGFREFARDGVPIAGLGLALAFLWFALVP